jgi:hypothetical protein
MYACSRENAKTHNEQYSSFWWCCFVIRDKNERAKTKTKFGVWKFLTYTPSFQNMVLCSNLTISNSNFSNLI